jgi:hypothetical protein
MMSAATDALDEIVAGVNAEDWDGFAHRFSADVVFAVHRGDEPVELAGSRLFV